MHILRSGILYSKQYWPAQFLCLSFKQILDNNRYRIWSPGVSCLWVQSEFKATWPIVKDRTWE